MTALNEIEQDLDWRVAEMATLKLLIHNSKSDSRARQVLLRAAWALLYAHYEGFCKFALTVYYDALVKSKTKNRDLPEATQAYALTGQIKRIRNLPAEEVIKIIKNFDTEVLQKEANFPEVSTDSNLNPELLKVLMVNADLQVTEIDPHSQSLATLVRRRNSIAHGERDLIKEPKYYFGYENSVTTIMYALACEISDKLHAMNSIAKPAPLVAGLADAQA